MIPLFKVFMGENVLSSLSRTLYSGYIGQGPKVEEFEKKLSKFIGNPLCLTTNNGTSALHLALHLANVKGGKVISTPMTCTATNWPILACGADIEWCDIDPMSGNIDPDCLAKVIQENPDSKAIVIVDWGGMPCNLLKILSIANQYQIPVIEDAAHSFGATYGNQKVGLWADFTVFSFQAIKHLTCVDGGALFVAHKEIYRRGKLLRWYGIDREGSRKDFRCENDVVKWGYKFNMNDVSATIGLSNFEFLPWILQRHRENASFYNDALKNIPGVKLLSIFSDRLSSYWLYTIRVEKRNDFYRKMMEQDIMVSRVHERNDIHSCVLPYKKKLPGVDEFVSEMVCIPVGWWVSESDREYIASTIRKGW